MENTNTDTRALAFDDYGNPYISGAQPGMEEDGDWDGTKYFTVNWDTLREVNICIALLAKKHGLGQAQFTTAMGSLIALGAAGEEAGYWHPDRGWVLNK